MRFYIEDTIALSNKDILETVKANGGYRAVLRPPSYRSNWPDVVKFSAEPEIAVKILEALESHPENKQQRAIHAWNEDLRLRLLCGRSCNVQDHIKGKEWLEENDNL